MTRQNHSFVSNKNHLKLISNVTLQKTKMNFEKLSQGNKGRFISIQPKSPKISVRNEMERTPFGSLLPGGIFGTATEGDPLCPDNSFWSVGLKCSFPLDKIVPLVCMLFARTISNCAVAWVESVQPECTVPLGT